MRKDRRWYAKRLGLSEDQWNKVQKRLDKGPCESCGKAGPVVMDHNHKTGKFRGLLCHQCNVGIGFFKDEPKLLLAAINYLLAKEEH